jgi:hypothetical protein
MQERDQLNKSVMGMSHSTSVNKRNAYKDLDRKPERMRPLGRLCADGF